MRLALGVLAFIGCSSGSAQTAAPDAAATTAAAPKPGISSTVKLTSGEIGIEACDRATRLMRACVQAMPAGESRSSAVDTIERSIDGWKMALVQGGAEAYQPIQDVCLRALDTVVPQMASRCPGVPTK